MAFRLVTQPALHRQHFNAVRSRLVGEPATAFVPEVFVSGAFSEARRTWIGELPSQLSPDQVISNSVSVTRRSIWATIGLRLTQGVLTLILLASIVLIGSFVLPEVCARIFPETVPTTTATTSNTHVSEKTTQQTPAPKPAYQPAYDPSLPDGIVLRIPSIGVDTAAQPTSTSEEALSTGVWLVPDFGRPGDATQPIIMAAHRFGWKSWWKSDYWRKNSFYLLTETKPGDRIEVIADHRKWVYEIYAGEEGELITDYDANLILYTCKFLNSPIRYFRYAKLVEV